MSPRYCRRPQAWSARWPEIHWGRSIDVTAAKRNSDWETVIGLEIHVQLKTRSKMFCGCAVEYGAPPNTLVCPVCLGLPGALPIINERAIELAALAAAALNCTVFPRSVFARKNYFYPDLPKGYQISQYDRPLARDGWLELPEAADGEPLRVRIRRLHVEEDSGKSLHDRFEGQTAVDLNRAGVPLAEIVTEPDLRSPAQARSFLVRLKRALEYLGVSDCNMEEGSLRVDANISVRSRGSDELPTKTEVKNMNSFSQLEKALEYEASRHAELITAGAAVEPETMLWDPMRNETRSMRGKEEVHDYRYFPEPDLPMLEISEDLIGGLRDRLPELPWQVSQRFVESYGLSDYEAEVLSADRALADYYEQVAAAAADARSAAKWIMREVMAVANERGTSPAELGVDPAELAELMEIVDRGVLPHSLGADVLRRMVETGMRATRIVEDEGLRKIEGGGELESWVAEALADNPGEVQRFREGEDKLLAFFIGQVMRKSKGRADPARLRDLLLAALSGARDERSGG
ncbi:MAG: Asp-tRNA(Asn)/Glu-tRNA(Gln) amidotransferase subunit GatB [Gemmatimonadota bacterium]|nr:MAG: Asp-tRNA(Asn)/Glu-tRNA(Gln) amidotransferase subunit GatB [Gemmatimonadota bacterium]